jgi:ubiquinol-cytochrome c reductase cytochrome b subunit
MKRFMLWLDQRTGVSSALEMCKNRQLRGRGCWGRIWPCTIVFAFMMQAITGFFLWAFYSPSVQTAWESVFYLSHDVPGGWLLRSIHHYTAHALLALLIVYIFQTIFARAYRAPRELVFWMTLGMGLFALAAILTGDLLPWDQNGYASTKTRTGFLTLLSFVGEHLLKLAIGGPGPELGQLTLTRFFALHVGLFAGGFLLLLIIHGFLLRRAEAAEAAGAAASVRYWPFQAWRGAVACLILLAAILALSAQNGLSGPAAGAPLGSPANTDPADFYAAARPEWFLTGVYEFSHWFAGPWAIFPIFIIPGLLVALALAMPFIARRTIGQYFNAAVTALLSIAVVALTLVSWSKDAGDADHQKAIAAERAQAERARVLVARSGVPPTGALTLLLEDPKTQGPKLFKQYCASCHAWTDPQGSGIKAELSETATPNGAPNLYRYAAPAWIEGILTRDRIVGADYFGNTKFRNGRMTGHVKEMWKDAEKDQEVDELKRDIGLIAATLSSQAKLNSRLEPTEGARPVDPAILSAGEKLMTGSRGCTGCHAIFNKPGVPGVPHLTDYGSTQWISGIIGNPGADRYYGKPSDRYPSQGNDRMPAYEGTLQPREIELLTAWLRGEWFEEEADNTMSGKK